MEESKDRTPVETTESNGNHSLGLQDLYKAAFSQLKKEEAEDEEPYENYSLKTIQLQAENNISSGNVTQAVSYGAYESCDNSSVLDLDQGIQVQVVKVPADETLTYNCDNPILQRYLNEASSIMTADSNDHATTDTIIYKPIYCTEDNGFEVIQSNVAFKIGTVDACELPGTNIEDCDFNSSDSFASTESIIPKNIPCPKCPKKFMFKSDLSRHDKRKHSSKHNLTCRFCNKKFSSPQNLSFHERSHKAKGSHVLDETTCHLCSKVFSKKSDFGKHMKTKHGNLQPFHCEVCPLSFGTVLSRNVHLEKHHNLIKESETLVKQSSDYVANVKSQSENQPRHVCNFCGKQYTKKSYLLLHERNHEEKNRQKVEEVIRYRCGQCYSTFINPANFELHLQNKLCTKTKEKVCTICNITFTSVKNLRKHMREHSLQCRTCLQVFPNKTQLNQHLKTGHKATQETYTQTEDLLQVHSMNIVAEPGLEGAPTILLAPLTSFNSLPYTVHITQPQATPIPYSIAS